MGEKKEKTDNKQDVKPNEETGMQETENVDAGLEISNDVIAVIAGVAVSEVHGVYAMSGGFAGRNI